MSLLEDLLGDSHYGSVQTPFCQSPSKPSLDMSTQCDDK